MRLGCGGFGGGTPSFLSWARVTKRQRRGWQGTCFFLLFASKRWLRSIHDLLWLSLKARGAVCLSLQRLRDGVVLGAWKAEVSQVAPSSGSSSDWCCCGLGDNHCSHQIHNVPPNLHLGGGMGKGGKKKKTHRKKKKDQQPPKTRNKPCLYKALGSVPGLLTCFMMISWRGFFLFHGVTLYFALLRCGEIFFSGQRLFACFVCVLF